MLCWLYNLLNLSCFCNSDNLFVVFFYKVNETSCPLQSSNTKLGLTYSKIFVNMYFRHFSALRALEKGIDGISIINDQ